MVFFPPGNNSAVNPGIQMRSAAHADALAFGFVSRNQASSHA